MSMEQFYTRDKANDGVKVPLNTPDGKPTEHYIVIRSRWSDSFQAAQAEVHRNDLVAMAEKGKDAPAQDPVERHATLCAALVSGWSFEQECTPDNIREFLKQAPQLRDMIDRYASNDARFFGKPSSDSTAGRKSK